MLKDLNLKTALPKDKPYKLTDGKGMYLLIRPDGAKYWRFDYRFAGKRKTIGFGVYPEVSLSEARERLAKARRLLRDGIDPSAYRQEAEKAKIEALKNTFEACALEWFSQNADQWVEGHSKRVITRLKSDVLPYIGKRPIREITAPEVLKLLRRIEDERGAIETAHKTKQWIGQIFRFGVATGRCDRDPAQDLKGALKPFKTQHFPSITEPEKVFELMRAIDGYQGSFIVKSALRLAPLVFVRPGELRKAEWCEFDFEAAQWVIPAVRMKMKSDHVVPLSLQALAVLQELHQLTGHGRYVFPGERSDTRPMSDNAVLAALRRMGFSKETMTGHGFRAMARTILDEVLGFRVDLIEHQLAHAVKDPLGRAYNRTTHIEERRRMMQAWADWLEGKKGADVVAFKRKG